MKYCQAIEVPQRLLEMIEEYLSETEASKFQGKDNTITYTAYFSNGYAMAVKCCGCDDAASWTEAVLFNAHGYELCCTEPCEDFDGNWEIEYEGNTFKVTVKAEESD